jgi:hypothetical protein
VIGGDVLMNDASTLSAGDGGAGTLSINGNLQLGSKTTSAFELGQAYTPGGALNDLINVAGDLQLDGTLDVTTSQGGNFGPGVYRIYNYGGTLDNQTLELGAIPNSQDKSNIFVQTSIDKQVNLVNANGVTLQFWDGATVNQSHGASGIEGDSKIDGGDGKWMAIGSQGDNNWTTATGEGNALGHRSPSPSSPPKAVPLPWITPREKLTSPEHSLMPMAMSLKAMRLTRMPPRKTRPTQARRRGLANCWCALALVARGKTIPRPLSPLSARPVLLTS